MEAPTAATWLRENFIASFVNDAAPRHWEENEGYFAIALLSLTYCCAAAGLVNAKCNPSDDEVIAFIKDYLGHPGQPSSERYRQRGAILYKFFRHRLAHQREPGSLRLEATPVPYVVVWGM